MKSLLESHDIDVFLKDELTIQTDNFLSNAMGGVKVQVKATDAPAAIVLLEEHGYLQPNAGPDETLWSWIEKRVTHIPVLRNMNPVLVFLLIVTLLLFMFVGFPLLESYRWK